MGLQLRAGVAVVPPDSIRAFSGRRVTAIVLDDTTRLALPESLEAAISRTGTECLGPAVPRITYDERARVIVQNRELNDVGITYRTRC